MDIFVIVLIVVIAIAFLWLCVGYFMAFAKHENEANSVLSDESKEAQKAYLTELLKEVDNEYQEHVKKHGEPSCRSNTYIWVNASLLKLINKELQK